MILADTSVWIEFFGKGESEAKDTLESLIKDHNQVCLCGIVIQEILQGIKDQKQFDDIKEKLSIFPYIGADIRSYQLAASIFRKVRSKGGTVPSIDALIAALAIRHNVLLYTLDKHFDKIQKYSGLRLFG